MSNPSFSIYAFRNWFSKQPEFEGAPLSQYNAQKVYGNLLNVKVESRLGIERLMQQIKKYNPELKQISELANCFQNIGGTIIEMNDLDVTIEVLKGKFILPKIYTKPSV